VAAPPAAPPRPGQVRIPPPDAAGPAPAPAQEGGFRHGGPLEPLPPGPAGPPGPGPGRPPGGPRAQQLARARARGTDALNRGRTAVARVTGPIPRIRPPASLRSPSGSGMRAATKRPESLREQWKKIAPVYDTDGPRIRLGVLWFGAAFPAVLLSTMTAGLLFAICGGLAARQVARAWRTEKWQADAVAGVAALPVLGVAFLGAEMTLPLLVVGALAALGLGMAAPCAGLRSGVGNVAAAGVLLQAALPVAVAGIAMVSMRAEVVTSVVLLFVLSSVYEMGDFVVGSGSSNKFEGPIAGGVAVMVTAFPFALLLIEPFDVVGMGVMLGIAAAACPVGQWLASAVLPWPGAHAPALRRMDTLLLLAPLWAVATGVVG